MKAILIFFFYFLSLTTIAGFAAFLMYHRIDGWGWLIFIDILLALTNVKVKN
ncbi:MULTISPECIES: hypothetical protein [Rodentibacter]|uniref:hypothetical protein n=1 Tax=Rodentibacter TaxID=1960084 RepID=UPI001CFD50F0|nr:hypothetical protein [Rodentibacter sp. JRC1]